MHLIEWSVGGGRSGVAAPDRGVPGAYRPRGLPEDTGDLVSIRQVQDVHDVSALPPRQTSAYHRDMSYNPDDQVDQYAPEPLYRQLAGILTARIRRGDWKPGDVIASESQLRQEYGVSRGTVRQAIGLLVERSLVVVAPQRGTYVKPAE